MSLPTTPYQALRSVECGYFETSDEYQLDRAAALVAGDLSDQPFAAATRLWLLLLRYDRTGQDSYLTTAVDRCEAAGWDHPDVVSAIVPVLLRRCARDGDAADLDQAITIATGVIPENEDGPLWQERAWRLLDLGRTHLERYRLRDTIGDVQDAIGLARRSLALTRVPVIRAIGLGLLASCEQELYLCTGERSRLDVAIRWYRQALGLVSDRSVVQPMLLTEFGTALQDRFAEDANAGDIDLAVEYAEQAVALAPPVGPDAACHLINLGTALKTRHEHSGNRRDLDQALLRWTSALQALPPASPYRPAFLDRLVLGLVTRWESGEGDLSDLDRAVEWGREAVRDATAMPDLPVYAGHLANTLLQRWDARRDPENLHEAVRVFDTALREHPAGARTTDLVANLAQTLLSRYQALGDLDDVDTAVRLLAQPTERDVARAQRATAAAARARALLMRYEATGTTQDLGAALTAARQSLTGTEHGSAVRASRTTRLAHLLYLRYLRQGRRADLDRAIALVRDLTGVASDAGEASEATPDQLNLLAVCLSTRYEQVGDPTDLDQAIVFGSRAQQLERGEGAPHLNANRAAAMHTRFGTVGWFEELDDAVDAYQAALAVEMPTAPSYPMMLSNLGIALQDRFIYHNDDAALAEAIERHEQALDSCPPGSPDRPGYLSTLAAAVQLRYERDTQPADLDRVIRLDEQALDVLPPQAPERGMLLTNLASARHLLAQRSTDPEDFDRAVVTFRAATRRIRGTHPDRPTLLRAYAGVLAERYDRFGDRGSRTSALRAYGQALATSEAAQVARLDAAEALGTCALRWGLWRRAADAYRIAGDARRVLSAAQLDTVQRDSWLRRGEHLGAAEAFARVRCGMLAEAVVALDSGRALRLSEVLDAGTIAGRLRAEGRDRLAERYERSVAALNRVVMLKVAGRAGAARTHGWGAVA